MVWKFTALGDLPLNVTIFITHVRRCIMGAMSMQVHFRLDFTMEANIMNPDHTAPMEQSDLGPYCLQYRLPKNISR